MSVLDRFSLSGKTALVTGCRRGIGMAMAVGLAEAGADIVGVSATLESSGSDIAKAVSACGRNFTPYCCDFSDRKALQEFAADVQKSHANIDILVNNAGTIKRAPAAEHDNELWDEVLEVNLSAQFILTREIGKSMLKRGTGKVIFTASLLTFQGCEMTKSDTTPFYRASRLADGVSLQILRGPWYFLRRRRQTICTVRS